MIGQDRAVRPEEDSILNRDDKEASAKGFALYEETMADGSLYAKGPSVGKPMKNVVIEVPNGPVTARLAIPREAFVDMVRKYFDIKGY